MLDIIKKQWKIQWVYGEMGTILVCLGGTFLLGFLGVLIFGQIFHIQEPVPVGTLGALVIAGFGQALLSCFGFMLEFNLAVSLGETRKSFVWGYQLFTLLKLIVIVLAVILFGIIEHYVYRTVFGMETLNFDIWEVLSFVKPLYIAVAMVGILAAEMLIQTLILRFGMKAFWVIWGFWMFVALVLPRLAKLPLWQPVKAFFSQAAKIQAGPAFWVIFTLAASVLAMAVSWGMLRKQRVTL